MAFEPTLIWITLRMTQFRMFGDVPLSRASLSSKMIVSLFLLSLLMAFGVGILNIWDKTGFTYQTKILRYRGADTNVSHETAELYYPRSLSELIELTHDHTFDMAMLLLMVGHLFQLTGCTERFKQTIWLLSFAGMFLFIWSPWLIKYVSPVCAVLLIIGEIILTVSFLILTLVPLYEMWWVTPPPVRRQPME
jgi:hypothetical protein